MNTLFLKRLLTMTAMLLCAASAFAQWLYYPTAGVPRTRDGKPNLAAPISRTVDGKPDLSGLWGNRCPTANGPVLCAPEVAVPQVFGDIGRSVKGGLPYQHWAAAHVCRIQEDYPDAGTVGDPERIQCQLSADFHGWPSPAGGSEPIFQWILFRDLGRRQPGGGDERSSRRAVARYRG
jgi:hypothetical protein